jgi:hypothetical protein
MTCVTTSLLIAGAQHLVLRVDGARAAASGPDSAAPKQNPAADPSFEKVADAIFGRLEKTTIEQAMTLEQIAKEFPNFTRDQIQEALKQMTHDGELKKTGTGDANTPYRYYERTAHTG